MRPFGCPVTILNTLDPLSKVDDKADEGFFVRYSINSKAFRVFNTRKVEENMHINFLENKPNVTESGLNWLFDIDLLTNSMNYEPSSKDAVSNDVGKKTNEDPAKEDDKSGQREATNTNSTNRLNTLSSLINAVSSSFTSMDLGRERVQRNEMFTPVNATRSFCDNLGGSIPVNAATLPNVNLPTDPLMPDLEDTADLLNTSIFSGAYC
ncbi:hypothetical protein Tco_0131651 [Tanacetum coccineum]